MGRLTGDDGRWPKGTDRRGERPTRKAQRRGRDGLGAGALEPANPRRFLQEIMPNVAYRPARATLGRMGLSVSYCAQVKRGERVPHPTGWDLLIEIQGLGRAVPRPHD